MEKLLDAVAEELAALDERASQPDFWNDSREAKRVLRAADGLREELDAWNGLIKRADDLAELAELAAEAGDEDLQAEVGTEYDAVEGEYERMRTSLLFSGPYDDSDAFISISAGAGGTEATDWAEMLLRMYLRWAERRGFDVELDSVSEGTEAGISSAEFIIKGRNAGFNGCSGRASGPLNQFRRPGQPDSPDFFGCQLPMIQASQIFRVMRATDLNVCRCTGNT